MIIQPKPEGAACISLERAFDLVTLGLGFALGLGFRDVRIGIGRGIGIACGLK